MKLSAVLLRRDASPVFELVEDPFDAIAQGMKRGVDRTLNLARPQMFRIAPAPRRLAIHEPILPPFKRRP